ncbi:bifunctional Regulator of chromosome condensation [Babesia duncani]|uniref:Bifunctional Regulator of chromosome condensation n=1 Tax=Babesia duncani TaxID=323732 RepID=A0AAD9PJR8_9APIC|nr:bifunctional Regulator of chromosome condensation [Babesia duncani]
MTERLSLNQLEPFFTRLETVSLGLNHGLAVVKNASLGALNVSSHKSAGTSQLYAWGKVQFNVLGLGIGTTCATTPNNIDFFNGRTIAQVACGDYHSCVLVVPPDSRPYNGGTVYSFGLGTGGRLGYSKQTGSQQQQDEHSWCSTGPNPVGCSLGLARKVMHIACGANHTLVTTIDGCMYAWGLGDFGVLGNGGVANAMEPVLVQFPQGIQIILGAAGCRHSLALDISGNCWSWGYGGNGRLGIENVRNLLVPARVVIFDEYELCQIAAGDSHSACLDRFGNVYTWGSHAGGKLGLGHLDRDVFQPRLVESLSGIQIVQIACGSGTMLALDSNGSVYQWGCILGRVDSEIMWTPQPLNVGSGIVHISAGPYSLGIINVFGDLLTWGVGSCFRLGHGTVQDEVVPKFVAQLRNRLVQIKPKSILESVQEHHELAAESSARFVSVGIAHGALVTCTGGVYCWGINRGSGAFELEQKLETLQEPMLLNYFSTKVRVLACGSAHTLVVTAAGVCFAWGANDSGQLGLGDIRHRVFPEQVFAIESAISVFAGHNNSAVITSTRDTFQYDEVGFLYLFGSSSGGKLGLGEDTSANILSPRKCNNISGVYKVALGTSHSLALLQDGTIYACGAAAHGKLGTGPLTVKNLWTWTKVASDAMFIDVAVGQSHSLAVSMDNQLYGWGNCDWLGIIVTNDPNYPVPTPLENVPAAVVKVAACNNHSLVLTMVGEIWAWGDNRNGQLGVMMKSSAIEHVPTPSLVPLDFPILQVVTGPSFSSCINRMGDVFTWGLSADGRLGIGPITNKIVYIPTRVSQAAMALAPLETDAIDNRAGQATALELFINEHRNMDVNMANWNALVALVASQDGVYHRNSLEAFEEDLVRCLDEHVRFILNMRSILQDLDLLSFKLYGSIRAAIGPERSVKPPPRFSNAIKMGQEPEIRRICQYLLLQPGYFCRLLLHGNEHDLTLKILTALYGQVHIPRLLNQIIAALLTCLNEEMKKGEFTMPIVPPRSAFALLLRAYVTLPTNQAANMSLFYGRPLIGLLQSVPNLKVPQPGAQEDVNEKEFMETLGHLGRIVQALGHLVVQMDIDNATQLVFSRLHDILKDRVQRGWLHVETDVEHLHYYPMVPIFIFALLQPWFQQCHLHAGTFAFDLNNIAPEKLKMPPTLVGQYHAISTLLTYLADPSTLMTCSPKCQHMVKIIYKSLTLAVIERLGALVNVGDFFDVSSTLTVLSSHYDPEPIVIQVPAFDFLSFCNSCARQIKVLYLSAHDPLVACIGKIRPMPIDVNVINQARSKRLVYTFRINHAFLIEYRNLAICGYTRIPVPQKLAYRQTCSSSTRSIHTQAGVSNNIKIVACPIIRMPPKRQNVASIMLEALENLVMTKSPSPIPNGPITLDEARQYLSQCTTYNASPLVANYEMAKLATKANEALYNTSRRKSNVALEIATILKARRQHHEYLVQVNLKRVQLDAAQANFKVWAANKRTLLQKCLHMQTTGNLLEPSISRAANVLGVQLYMWKPVPGVPKESQTLCCQKLQDQGLLVAATQGLLALSRIKIKVASPKEASFTLHLQQSVSKQVQELASTTLSIVHLESLLEASQDASQPLFITDQYPQGMCTINSRLLLATLMDLL